MRQAQKGATKSGVRPLSRCLWDKESRAFWRLGKPYKVYPDGWGKIWFSSSMPLSWKSQGWCYYCGQGGDANYIITRIEVVGAKVLIPKSNRTVQRVYDVFLYKKRNIIERIFCKMKQFRGIPKRYSKMAIALLAWIQLAAILLWLKWISTRPSFEL